MAAAAARAILIDRREPEWVQSLGWDGVPAAVGLLDAGDVQIATEDGCLVAIERKTAADLLASIRDDRLSAQVRALRALTPWAYLVICGELRPGTAGKAIVSGHEIGWNWASVQGALLTVQELGVHVVHVPGAGLAEFEAAVLRLVNRDRSTLAIGAARESVAIADAEQVLMAFPGIGYERAQRILGYCGTLAHALVYLSNDAWKGTREPSGIGRGLKERARHVLGLKPDEAIVIDRPEWTEQAIVREDEGVTV